MARKPIQQMTLNKHKGIWDVMFSDGSKKEIPLNDLGGVVNPEYIAEAVEEYLEEHPVEPYDDTEIKAQIEEITQYLEENPPYDDTEITEQIEELDGRVDTNESDITSLGTRTTNAETGISKISSATVKPTVNLIDYKDASVSTYFGERRMIDEGWYIKSNPAWDCFVGKYINNLGLKTGSWYTFKVHLKANTNGWFRAGICNQKGGAHSTYSQSYTTAGEYDLSFSFKYDPSAHVYIQLNIHWQAHTTPVEAEWTDWFLYEGKLDRDFVSYYGVLDKHNIINTNHKVLVLGDSISEGTLTDSDQSVWEFLPAVDRWGERVAEKLSAKIDNHAYRGSGIVYENNSHSGIAEADSTNFSPYDVIFIAYWFNDYFQSIPIGTKTDTETTTFYGGLNHMLTKIKASNPKATIVIIPPYNICCNGTYDTNYGYGYKINNNTLLDFYDALKTFADDNGLLFVDMKHSCFNRNNSPSLLLDGIHPSEDGYEKLNAEMCGKILALLQY